MKVFNWQQVKIETDVISNIEHVPNLFGWKFNNSSRANPYKTSLAIETICKDF